MKQARRTGLPPRRRRLNPLRYGPDATVRARASPFTNTSVTTGSSLCAATAARAFLRAGWADGGGGILERSVSIGLGHQNKPGGNLLGVGLNWGRPSSETFGTNLDDQWTAEAFCRLQLTENIQITPDVQILVNPALNPDEDVITLFGLRARVTL